MDDKEIEELWKLVGGRDEAVTRNQIEALAQRIIRARQVESEEAQRGTEAGHEREGSADLGCLSASVRAEELSRLESWFVRHRLTPFLH